MNNEENKAIITIEFYSETKIWKGHLENINYENAVKLLEEVIADFRRKIGKTIH